MLKQKIRIVYLYFQMEHIIEVNVKMGSFKVKEYWKNMERILKNNCSVIKVIGIYPSHMEKASKK